MHDPEKLRSIHRARFGAEPALFAAPGRVNLIGEHTDYAEGFVMPVAINFATLAAISPRANGKIVFYAENYREEAVFDAGALPASASHHWSRLSDGRRADPRRRRPRHSRLQHESLGRCAPGLGTFELGGA